MEQNVTSTSSPSLVSTIMNTFNNLEFKYADSCAHPSEIRISNTENGAELLRLVFSISLKVFWSLFLVLSDYILVLLSVVILVLVIFGLYKSYWCPVVYVKELTDIGFEHLKGPNKDIRVIRAQLARRLGSKLPPPYPNGWFCVAEIRDLKVGGVIAVDALGQNLCVYRGEDGAARCVDAYCPHLGANLAVGGSVCGNCIECPFHKWKFSSTGQCVSVPGQETPPKGVSIRTWTTSEADGGIWIWHDSEGREPLWNMTDAPQCKSWGYRGRNEFIVNSHIQDIPENGADVAHLNAVHSPSLFTNLGERYPCLLNVIGRHTWAAQWSKGEDHTAEMRLTHDYKFGKVGLFHMDVIASQIGPGHVRLQLKTPIGPVLISQSVTPLSPLEQKVVHRFYSPFYNAPIAAIFVPGESYMFERDIVIWNNKRFISNPAYVRLDRTIRSFRGWYSQFYTENSVSFKDAVRKQQDPLDW